MTISSTPIAIAPTMASSFSPYCDSDPRTNCASTHVIALATRPKIAPMKIGRRRRRLTPMSDAVIAARMRTASRPSRKTMIAALVLALGGDLVLWSYLSGMIFALALTFLVWALANRLIGSPWGLLAGVIVATHQGMLLYTARGAGLETGFFALLTLLAVWAYLDQRLLWVGGLLALASLTRPEGVLLFALTFGHALASRTIDDRGRLRFDFAAYRGLLPLLAAYLLIFVPYFAWRFDYYGDLLPNTFYAKTGGGLRAIGRGLRYAGGFALTMGGPLLLLGLLWPKGNWLAHLRGWRGYLLMIVGVYSAYIVAVGGDHFRGERFFVPLVALFALLLSGGVATLVEWLPKRGQIFAQIVVAIVLIPLATMALWRIVPDDYNIRGLDESVWIWRDLGDWMAQNTPPEASIAATGAGAIAFYGQRETIDLHGLTDRHIARVEMPEMGSGVAGHEKADPEYVLNERQPTYIPQMWEDYFGGEDVLLDRYELITVQTPAGRMMELWQRQP